MAGLLILALALMAFGAAAIPSRSQRLSDAGIAAGLAGSILVIMAAPIAGLMGWLP